jgi:hypothetical protein
MQQPSPSLHDVMTSLKSWTTWPIIQRRNDVWLAVVGCRRMWLAGRGWINA